MKRVAFLQHLNRQGCVLIGEGSNHSWWGNPRLNTRPSVPRQTEIDNFPCRKICKDLGIAKP